MRSGGDDHRDRHRQPSGRERDRGAVAQELSIVGQSPSTTRWQRNATSPATHPRAAVRGPGRDGHGRHGDHHQDERPDDDRSAASAQTPSSTSGATRSTTRAPPRCHRRSCRDRAEHEEHAPDAGGRSRWAGGPAPLPRRTRTGGHPDSSRPVLVLGDLRHSPALPEPSLAQGLIKVAWNRPRWVIERRRPRRTFTRGAPLGCAQSVEEPLEPERTERLGHRLGAVRGGDPDHRGLLPGDRRHRRHRRRRHLRPTPNYVLELDVTTWGGST